MPAEFVVYVVRCADGSLYTGIAKDVEARIKTHNAGKGAAYTRARLPVTLLYQEPCKDRSAALVREIAIKRLPKEKKEKLVLKVMALLMLVGSVARAERLAPRPPPDEREGERILGTVPEGWEIDSLAEPGRPALPKVAWSKDLETVLFVARKDAALKIAVNTTLTDASEVATVGFAQDGRSPVFNFRAEGGRFLQVGAQRFGPYEEIGEPALDRDGTRSAFRAQKGRKQVIVSDGKVAAQADFASNPTLDPLGRVAYWAREKGKWTLWWDGRKAPGTPFKSGSEGHDEVGDPVFSPDGKHVAFWHKRPDGRFEVVRDGKTGESWLQVGVPTFSPDGESLAYGGAAGPDYELNTMVIGDRKIAMLESDGPKSIRYLWGYRYLSDGRLAWFAQLMGGKSCFVIGDQPSPAYDSVSQPALDPDGRHLAFAGVEAGKARAVLDGVAGPVYDAVNFLQFDPAGGALAYTARKASDTYVVAGGAPGERFDEVGWIRFAPKGGGIAYWARRGKEWQIVVGDQKSPVAVGADLVGNLILGGPQGRTPVYSVRQDARWYLLAGAQRFGPFDEIGSFFYDPVSNSVVAGTRDGRDFQRRIFYIVEAR